MDGTPSPKVVRLTSLPPETTDSPPSNSPFQPYTTPNHTVSKGRYITSTDPRGYVPVYEYPLNNQWIMMDVDDGYVLWTGIWKALGNNKADITKMVEAQPELASRLRRVRGGYLKIQGTWLPYEVALRLARRVAWPIRHDLIPLFGPTFPDTCLAPNQPGYGQILGTSGRRSKRSKYTNPGREEDAGVGGSSELSGPSPSQYQYHPYSPPGSGTGAESPYDNASPVSASGGAAGGGFYGHYYQAMPTAAPGPPPSPFPPSHHPHYRHTHDYRAEYNDTPPGEESSGDTPGPSSVTRKASLSSSSGSRHRYAPYPPSSSSTPGPPAMSSTPRQESYAAALPPSPPSSTRSIGHPPSQHTRYNLPPISTMDLPRPHGHQQGLNLPPISSLREGDKPEMDASTVLKRLRLDDHPHPEDEHRPSTGGSYAQYQAVPAWPPGPPTYEGDPRYQSYPSRGSHSPSREWHGHPPPPSSFAEQTQHYYGVQARGGGPRRW